MSATGASPGPGPRAHGSGPVTIAVVVPCYRVRKQVLGVLGAIGPECAAIYAVDDACPEGSGDRIEAECDDPRVRVLRHASNRGVGGATLTGYRAALADGADVVVKLDGDGQMDPAWIPRLVQPILEGEADYAKGNRFFDLDGLRAMPTVRVVGNSLLSFASKLSSGYWNLFDPTNGFTAIHAAVARRLPMDKLSPGWFFESDMLFRLGILRAAVVDVPMPAIYGDQESSLVVRRVIGVFARRHAVNTAKRIFYNYYLRSFNIASVEVALGVASLLFGVVFGGYHWVRGTLTGDLSSSGTVMLAALPVIVGVQLVLAFLSYDLQNVPTRALHRRLAPAASGARAQR